MNKLTRRGFLHASVGAGIVAAAEPLGAERAPRPFQQVARPTVRTMANRPNILYVIMEDIGPQLACYGEPLVRTPHVDRLASEGVRFLSVYSAAPVCSASRSSLMTGNYQTRIGAHQHRTWQWHKKPLTAPVRHISEWFRDAGYYTCNLQPPKESQKTATPRDRMHGAAGSGKVDLNFFLDAPDKGRFFDGIDWNERVPGQPFFAHITIIETHKGEGWAIAREQPQSELVDPTKVKLASFYPDSPIARDEYANYLDAIHLCDGYVGELLQRLEKDGLANNTIVVLSSDHGQCLFRSKQFLYDGGIHIPLIVRFPDGQQAGTIREDLISGIDIAPMLLGLAGIEAPAGAMQGQNPLDPHSHRREHIFAARDRMDVAIDRMRAVRTRDYKYIRNYLPAIPYMQSNPYKEANYPTWNLVKALAKQERLTKEQASFAAQEKQIEELFDLRTDPSEVHNLAKDPAYEATLTEMRKLIDGFVAENDRLVTYEDSLDVFRGFYGRMPEEKPVPGKGLVETA